MPSLRRYFAAALPSLIAAASPLQAQNAPSPKRFEFSAYAVLNYLHFDWDTERERRAEIDLERLVLEGVYTPSSKVSFEAEVELEHGGSGASVEFDDGEFETEVEKGGEVVVEELHATFALKDWLDLRVGHFYVPVGFLSSKYQP